MLEWVLIINLLVLTGTAKLIKPNSYWENNFNIEARSRARDYLPRLFEIEHKDGETLWAVEFPEAYSFECHSAIRTLYGNKYGVLNQGNGIVESNESQLSDVARKHPQLSHCFAQVAQIPPIAKISKNVASLFGGDRSFHPSGVDLIVIVTPSLAFAPSSNKLEFVNQLGHNDHLTCPLIVDPRSLQEFISSAGEVLIMKLTYTADCGEEDAALRLARFSQVQWVDLHREVTALNRWAAPACQSGDVNIPLLHWANITGEGEVIGMADSGLDTTSCFFHDDNVDVPYNTYSSRHRKIASYHTYIDGIDEDGHGTLAAGAALGACVSKKYRDSAAFDGMAPGARISFLDIGRGSGSSEDPAVIRPPSDIDTNLLSVIRDDGARVMSLSWGVNSNDYETYSRLLDRFMWMNPEALVVVAGGNNGETGFSTMFAPAVAKNCLAVGATLNDAASWDEFLVDRPSYYSIKTMAGFSSRGPTGDGRHKPDVVAPGYFVTTSSSNPTSTVTPELHCSTEAVQGTSFATPLVSGAAVLLRQWFIRGNYGSAGGFVPSGALLKAMLVHSGQAMTSVLRQDGSVKDTVVGDYWQGYGRVQLDRVLSANTTQGVSDAAALSLFVVGAVDSSSEHYAAMSASGEQHNYQFRVGSANDPLKVTLVYTDFPAAAQAKTILVNDLDITVSNGSHVWYSLHATKESSASATKPPSDRINNVEVIVVPSPSVDSIYTLTVTAKTLQVTQPYALVATSSLAPIKFVPQSKFRNVVKQDAGLSLKARAVIAGLISVAALLLFYALWFMGFMSFLNFDKWCKCLVGGKKKKKNVARTASRAGRSTWSGCCGNVSGSSQESVPAPESGPTSSPRLWSAIGRTMEQVLERTADVGIFRFGSEALKAKAASDSFEDECSESSKDNDGGEGQDVVGYSGGLEQAEGGGVDSSGQDWREISTTSTQPPRSPPPIPSPSRAMHRPTGQEQTPPRASPRASDKSHIHTVKETASRVAYPSTVVGVASGSPSVLLGDSLSWEPSPDSTHSRRTSPSSRNTSKRASTGMASTASVGFPSPLDVPSPRMFPSTVPREEMSMPSPIEPVPVKASRRRHSESGAAQSKHRVEQRRSAKTDDDVLEDKGQERDGRGGGGERPFDTMDGILPSASDNMAKSSRKKKSSSSRGGGEGHRRDRSSSSRPHKDMGEST